jgi:leader peptidase (prepilin peptidase)/N-methyltransferase
MGLFIGIISFIFGTIIGSFLNVVSLRHNTGKSLSGRSFCFSCGKALEWYELVPLFSFIFQRGRCGKCRSLISWQYPTVEFITGLVFLAIAYKWFYFGDGWIVPDIQTFALFLYPLFYTFIFPLLIVIGAYDIKHKIIPDKLVYLLISVAFLRSLAIAFISLSSLGGTYTSVLPDILSGLIIALPLFLVWLVSRGRAMGFGDVKLALGLGFMLPLSNALAGLMISFWAGGIVGIVLLSLSGKKITMKTEVPFAPFLIFGTAMAFFFDIDFLSLIGLLS